MKGRKIKTITVRQVRKGTMKMPPISLQEERNEKGENQKDHTDGGHREEQPVR